MTAAEKRELLRVQEWITRLMNEDVAALYRGIYRGEMTHNDMLGKLQSLSSELDNAQGVLWELSQSSEEQAKNRSNDTSEHDFPPITELPEEVLHVDATPNEDYPLRILRGYLQRAEILKHAIQVLEQARKEAIDADPC